jgi:HK97 family phage prohead protease
MKGVFSKSIQERGPKSKANQKIVICWQHDIEDPIGQPTEIVEDDLGAYTIIKWDSPEFVPNSGRAQHQIETGTINGWSFGFDPIWDKMTYDEVQDTIWMHEVELYEISPVTFASMTGTHTVRSKAELDSAMLEFNEEVDIVMATLPRKKQLEVRQLLTKHKSLLSVKPDQFEKIKKDTLRKKKPKPGLISRIAKQIK